MGKACGSHGEGVWGRGESMWKAGGGGHVESMRKACGAQ